MSQQIYTTKLQAGLGLSEETRRLLEIWEPGMSGQTLLQSVLSSGSFPNISARRLRNIVIEAYVPRYLAEGDLPAVMMKALMGHVSFQDWNQLLFLYTARANAILADFVREIYWLRYRAGSVKLTMTETIDFVRGAVATGKTAGQWADTTIIRVSRYLLGACSDFGLLGPNLSGARDILPFNISETTASILAHDLHFKGFGDNALIHHDDWALYGLESEDVLQELKMLALRGEMIIQAAADVVQISWKHKSMGDVINGIIEG